MHKAVIIKSKLKKLGSDAPLTINEEHYIDFLHCFRSAESWFGTGITVTLTDTNLQYTEYGRNQTGKRAKKYEQEAKRKPCVLPYLML